MLDGMHMFKLLCGLLHDQKILIWKDVGRIRWEFIERLHYAQKHCGLRAANRLRDQHINFKRSKMCVGLAVQTTASHSVASSLRLCHNEGLKGFTDEDVITTAQFLDLNDKLLDLINGKSPLGKGLKVPIGSFNRHIEDGVFAEAMSMFENLCDEKGRPIFKGPHKTALVGLASNIVVIQKILNDIESGSFSLRYILGCKFSQDHLEIFFR